MDPFSWRKSDTYPSSIATLSYCFRPLHLLLESAQHNKSLKLSPNADITVRKRAVASRMEGFAVLFRRRNGTLCYSYLRSPANRLRGSLSRAELTKAFACRTVAHHDAAEPKARYIAKSGHSTSRQEGGKVERRHGIRGDQLEEAFTDRGGLCFRRCAHVSGGIDCCPSQRIPANYR